MIKWSNKHEQESDLFRLYQKRLPHHYRKWEYPWCWLHSDVQNGMRLLDVGGGDSFFLENFLHLDCELISTTDPGYISFNASRHPAIQIKEERMEEMTFADNYFDRVFCQGVMEHVPQQDRIKGMKQMARVLKPGGMLLLTYDYFYPARNLEHFAPYVQSIFFRLDLKNPDNVNGRELIDAVPDLEPWQMTMQEPIYGDKDFSESYLTDHPDITQNMIPLVEGSLSLTFIGIILYKKYTSDHLMKLIPSIRSVHTTQRLAKAPIMRYINGTDSFKDIMDKSLRDSKNAPQLSSRIPNSSDSYVMLFNELIKNKYVNLKEE